MKLTKRAFLAGSGTALVSALSAARLGHAGTGDNVLHRCGVVEIRTKPEGGVGIYGWQDLVPNDAPVFEPRHGSKFIITASFEDKILEVHERSEPEGYLPRVIWPVVTPDPSELPGTVDGAVYRIEMQPDWSPGESLRRKYQAYRRDNPDLNLPPLPAGTVPYGHPANPMGERKIRANWRGRYFASAVLHGTAGYPVELCSAETSGCVRLHNQWIIPLVDEILGGEDHALSVGVECFLTPQSIVRRS